MNARAKAAELVKRMGDREPTPMEIDAIEELLLIALLADIDNEFTQDGSPF